MILGHINHIENEQQAYHPAIRQALAYLKATDFTTLPEGRHTIDGDTLFFLVSDYRPEDKQQRKAETHNAYIDIQYIVTGEESIGIAALTPHAEISENRLTENDAIFYQNVQNETAIVLQTGMFMVLFPWDIHRPGCISRPDIAVRKVVFKLAVSQVFA